MNSFSDQELIKNYLKGDEKSLEVLIGRYLKPVYSYVFHSVSSRENAEDITQEAFIKAWKNIRKFKKEKSFKSWIFTIAKNTLIDFYRKKGTIPFSMFEGSDGQNSFVNNLASPLKPLEDFFNDKNLAEAIVNRTEKLPAKSKKIFVMRHSNGLSFREIAEQLEEPLNTVKSRYRRTTIWLKEQLK